MLLNIPDGILSTGAKESEPADLDRRFSGLARLYGVAGASRIGNSHVAVIGLGGVGSWAAEAWQEAA